MTLQSSSAQITLKQMFNFHLHQKIAWQILRHKNLPVIFGVKNFESLFYVIVVFIFCTFLLHQSDKLLWCKHFEQIQENRFGVLVTSKSTVPESSSSISLIISMSSCSVGFWPMDLSTTPSSSNVMLSSPSTSNRLKMVLEGKYANSHSSTSWDELPPFLQILLFQPTVFLLQHDPSLWWN